MSWQCSVVIVLFTVGTAIQGLLILNDPNYNPERWQGTLLIIAATAFAIVFNTVLAQKLPILAGFTFVFHVLGLIVIITPLWILAPRNSAKAVFTEFTNLGGWNSMGTAVLVGLSTPLAGTLGFDCAVHMCK